MANTTGAPTLVNTVFVDSRVGSKELLTLLRGHRLKAELACLDAADFVFEGRGVDGPVVVGVERKTIGDLVASLQSGRFQGQATESNIPQLARMRETFDYSWLLIEGRWSADKQGRLQQHRRHGTQPVPGGVSMDSLLKRLFSIALQGEVRMWQTGSPTESAAWVASLFRWFNDKAWDEHRTLHATYKPHSIRPLSRFRERALSLPGVGLSASLALEKAFAGDERRLLDASPDTLAAVDVRTPAGPRRLGTTRARAIYDVLVQLKGQRGTPC